MKLNKGQSTAEYAILIGLVIAIAAGILSALLRGGMTHKQHQAMTLLDNAGNSSLTDESGLRAYTQEGRTTTVDAGKYVDQEVMLKGGATEKTQTQASQTNSITVEMLNETQGSGGNQGVT